jgi:glycosyltransferase involved in cell wall biosynthesis
VRKSSAPTVLFLPKSLPHYRVAFFISLREALSARGVQMKLIYGDPSPKEALRSDTMDISWAEFRPNRFIGLGPRAFVWQPTMSAAATADIVVVEDAAKLLINYPLTARQILGRARIALWGHGGNLQRLNVHRGAEAVKRALSRRAHWWFAYTEATRARVERLGYPSGRITVVQNSIDTKELSDLRRTAGLEAAQAARKRLDLGDGPVGVFVGALYAGKRLPFLFAAADAVVRRLPDFRLLIVGDGPDRDEVERLAALRPYVRCLGPLFGEEKVRMLAAGSVMLVPGLVGLTVLDAFALELPLLTTAADSHGPEIEYLVNGDNGLVVDSPNDPESYAREIVGLLCNPDRLSRLRDGCRRDALRYTNEAMVDRFAGGVLEALAASRRSRVSCIVRERAASEAGAR